MNKENLHKKYWVGICPPLETEEYVAVFKKELEKKLGWYSSVNSKAHISFREFFDYDGELLRMEQFLSKFCNTIEPFKVVLNCFGRFGRAYCLLPDDSSRKALANLMRQFHKRKPFDKEQNFDKPHVSIGRNFTEEQLAIATQLFETRIIHHEFLCSDIVIRKFNPALKQYEIYKRFKLSKPSDLLLF